MCLIIGLWKPYLNQRLTRFSTSHYLFPGGNTFNSLSRELRDWRRRTADELQRPIYRILSNDVIDSIVSLKPRNRDQLSLLSGIGPAKLKQYGQKILTIVSKYIGSNEIDKISEALNSTTDTSSFWTSKLKIKTSSTEKVKRKKKKDTVEEMSAEGVKKPKKKRMKVMTAAEIEELSKAELLSPGDLNEEQLKAAEHVLEGHNTFITGTAGMC